MGCCCFVNISDLLLALPARKRPAPARAPRRRPTARKKTPERKKAPTRKKTAARRKSSPRKRSSGGSRKRASKRRARSAGAGGRGWLWRSGLVLGLGVLLGVSIVGLALWREAQVTVAARLEGATWATPGRVYSGPLEVWRGLSLTPARLGSALRAAGYAQTGDVRAPGDFRLSADAVLVKKAAASGPGWSIPSGEVLIAFRDGRVSSVSPSSPARLAPAVLSTQSGASAERRQLVPLHDIPQVVQDCVLAMEDHGFYEHPGLSVLGVARALFVNLREGRTVQGGSTLTQQLAKNLFLDPERSLARKAREALLALALEEQLEKEEILELYLNGIYLGQAGGQAIHGVAEAARVYFGKPVDRLDLGEAATLAGIISAPNAWSPLRHPEQALERRDLVLRRLVQLGRIDQAAADAVLKNGLEVRPTAVARGASWGVDHAVELVEAQQGPGTVISRGLHVYTSLSPFLQELAEQAVREGLAEVERAHPKLRGVQAALVVLDARSGQVLAMVGGRDYGTSSFNRAVHGRRQVGSLIKPLTLVQALEADRSLHLATRLPDEPLTRRSGGKSWQPSNYDGRYEGQVSVRRAIVHSRNIPAIHLAERVGMKKLQRFWRGLGLDGATALPSAALGAFEGTPLQLASAYSVFPGGGQHVEPLLLLGAADPAGEAVTLGTIQRRAAVSQRSASMALCALRGVIRDGTGRGAGRYDLSGAVGGKTGTTDDGRDAWFVGFSPSLVAAVWVGFDKGRSHGLSGAGAALPIWARFMAASGTTRGSFRHQAALEEVVLCAESLLPAAQDCPERYTEHFPKDQVPSGSCPLHSSRREARRAAEQGEEEPARDRQGVLQRLRERMARRKKKGGD